MASKKKSRSQKGKKPKKVVVKLTIEDLGTKSARMSYEDNWGKVTGPTGPTGPTGGTGKRG